LRFFVKNKTAGKSQNLFIFLSVFISLSISLFLAEWVLRYQRQSAAHEIQTSEKMQPGMILYDAKIGWRLKPYWSGKHHHYDYDAIYNINRDGFRGVISNSKDVRYAIIGDSFSFGLGVNDKQTFTAILNSHQSKKIFRNYSVPGYSTDQQLLLLNKLKAEITNDVILVVYLGNDIFDNMRNFPLQAEHGKPSFKLVNSKLVLTNVPVPHSAKPAAAAKDTISNIVLGNTHRQGAFLAWLSQLEISRRLNLFQNDIALAEDEMAQRFSPSLKLFTALIDEIEKIVVKNNARLTIVLLPGRSYVEQTVSVSAQYQDYFRRHIKSSFSATSINVMDFASHLRVLHNEGINGLYYPNEGHLTSMGHKYLADYLADQLSGYASVTSQKNHTNP